MFHLRTFSLRSLKASPAVLSKSIHSTQSSNMPIKVGDKIPSVDLFESTPATKVNIAELSSKGKVVLFAVPGAFTPGCSKTHLPGYVEKADDIKSKGVSEIVCVSVNDPFVMDAWGKAHNATGKLRLLADPSAAFTKALELETDIPPLGGIRSKRYSMLIENGVVKSLDVEPDGTGLSCSLAQKMVEHL
ncbi:peroxiredoxin-5, mitochondrial [Ischnura elegans]|uniref:peroxiredoxin-5, mitochondrial n=1 Tax=Ischnura elegans TaxID=197161 RepID=UPI001ED8A037|nr:peroxiredoxin-5, mitochondrial [Ischnura elegans]